MWFEAFANVSERMFDHINYADNVRAACSAIRRDRTTICSTETIHIPPLQYAVDLCSSAQIIFIVDDNCTLKTLAYHFVSQRIFNAKRLNKRKNYLAVKLNYLLSRNLAV